MENALKYLLYILFTLILFGCGGSGGSGGSNNGSNPNIDYEFEVSPGGIWSQQFDVVGPFELDSEFILGNEFIVVQTNEPDFETLFEFGLLANNQFFVSENGRVLFQQLRTSSGTLFGFGEITRSDEESLEGMLQVQRLPFSEPNIGLVGITPVTPDMGECTLSGSAVARSALYLSLLCEFEDGSSEMLDIDLEPIQDCSFVACSNSETVYESDFTLSDIAGSYSSAFLVPASEYAENPGLELPVILDEWEISSDGNITGLFGPETDSCQVDGNLELDQNGFNLFTIEWTYSNCELVEDEAELFQGLGTVRTFEDILYLEIVTPIYNSNQDAVIAIADFVYQKLP